MGKINLSTGQPVFSQLLKLIPTSTLDELIKKHQTDRYCKTFKGYNHVVTMLYACFHRCSSLSEVITGMQANCSRLYHLGLHHTPRKSTLADANKRTSHLFFSDLFHELQKKYYGDLPDSRKREKEGIFIIDSTTITLFSDVMQGAGTYGLNGKKKGGAKAHVVLSAKHDVPAFVYLTEAKVADLTFLNKIDFLPPKSIIVMDRGYKSYKKFAEWSEKNITWVTRLNGRAVWSIVEEYQLEPADQKAGIRKDYLINLGNPVTSHLNAIQRARLVIFYDKKRKREFMFLTNDLTSDPQRIANLYKKRWQIELVFKRLKSNFPLRYFLGDSENAVKIQIWCALIADLLIKIVQDKVEKLRRKKWAFANIAGLIRIHLSTYIDLIGFLINPDHALIKYVPPEESNQTSIFRIEGLFSSV